MKPALYVQYHNADDRGLPLSDHYNGWWMETKKALVKKAVGAFCFLIVGITENRVKNYYLWSFFQIQNVDQNDTKLFDVFGDGIVMKPRIPLKGLNYFEEFSKREYKNFGLGFMDISKLKFSDTLYNLTPAIKDFVEEAKEREGEREKVNRYLDPNTAWDVILAQAEKAHSTNDTWESPKQKRNYKIKEKPGKNILIERQGHHEHSSFGKLLVKERIDQINASNGSISRVDFTGHVAKMAAIVHLHPQLSWSDDFETIIVISGYKPKYKDYGAAPNDNPEDLQYFARKVRRGQKKFRDNLLIAYGSQCCISGSDVEPVLDACHISPHSKTGDNRKENGLLLRTDLHNLFDAGFIQIEPATMIIHIHPQLSKSEYWQYNGKNLGNRVDSQAPSSEFLNKRWNGKEW